MSRPGRLNRYLVEKALMEKSQGNVRPWEIGQWTLGEALAFLEDPKQLGHAGPNMSDAEIKARRERRQAMTPLERLREAQN